MSGIICFRVFHLQLGAARDNLVARCSLLVAVGTNMSSVGFLESYEKTLVVSPVHTSMCKYVYDY